MSDKQCECGRSIVSEIHWASIQDLKEAVLEEMKLYTDKQLEERFNKLYKTQVINNVVIDPMVDAASLSNAIMNTPLGGRR